MNSTPTTTVAPLSEAEIVRVREHANHIRFVARNNLGGVPDVTPAHEHYAFAGILDRLLSEREADKKRIREAEALLRETRGTKVGDGYVMRSPAGGWTKKRDAFLNPHGGPST